MVSRYGRVPVVGGDDFAHERVADHVFGLQVGEGDVVDAVEDAFDGGQT